MGKPPPGPSPLKKLSTLNLASFTSVGPKVGAGGRTTVSTEWLPQAVSESGYCFGAVLAAQNIFARPTMTQLVVATRELPHRYRTFETEETVVVWLLKPDRY